MTNHTNTLLIIDNNLDKELTDHLLSAGYKISYSLSNNLALNHEKLPELILLNMQMDGLEILRQLKSDNISSEIPVVLISNSKNNLVQAFQLGAADYLAKPFDDEELLARVNTQLQLRNKQISLKNQTEKLHQSLQEAFFSIDSVNKKMLHVSAAHETVFGYPSSEFFKNPMLWYDLIIPADKPIIDANYFVLYKGNNVRQVFRIIRPDGQLRWIEAKLTPTLDSNGNLIRVDGIASDITEYKQVEEALYQSEIKHKTLLNHISDVIGIIDFDGKNKYTSPNVEKWFGWKPEELEGSDIYSRFHADDVKKVRRYFSYVLAKDNLSRTLECRYKCKNNSYKWIEFTAVNCNKIPSINGILLNFRDITERRNAEDKLKFSEEKYKSLIEVAKDSVLINLNNKIIYVNPAAINLLGANTADQIIGKSTFDIFPASFHDEMRERQKTMIQHGLSVPIIEQKVIRLDGTPVDIEIVATPFLYRGEKAIHVVLRDIRERLKTENEFKKLSRAVEYSPLNIFITDPDGKIEYVNPKFCEITGYSAEEVVGKNPRILQSGEKKKEDYKVFWDTILSGKIWRGEFHNKKKNGEHYWEDSIISSIFNQEGKITHFVAIKEDVTEKKKMIQDLIAAKEKAEEMSRLKSSFLANMSHELRTPLVGILGYSEILSGELENPDHLNMINNIFKSSTRLNETLNLILDLSKVECDKVEISAVENDVIKLTQESIDLFYPAAALKNLNVETIIKDENILAILDERLYAGILDNLLNNAVKFTTQGSISIEIGKEKISDKSWFYVKIKDTGIGIPKEKIGLIFEEFRQISEGLGRSFEGTGLGLTLAKKITELMGGKISVESEPEVGSVFTITFPALDTN